MLTSDELNEVRWCVKEWLYKIGITQPPIPVYEVAAYLGYPVRVTDMWSATLAERRRVRGKPEILVYAGCTGDPTVRHRRLRFAVCHEVMALQFPEFSANGRPGAERVYQRCASELLLYRPWLAECGSRVGWNLPEIVEQMDASWEATTRALLDADELVLTIPIAVSRR